MTQDVVGTLRSSGLVETFGAASRHDIERAQQALGVEFPRCYVEFLSSHGVMLVATIPLPRRVPLPLSRVPGAHKLGRAGLGDPETPVHDRFVFGLGSFVRDNPTESVVFQNTVARGTARLRLPTSLLAIWDDWHYYYHCLDLRRQKRGDCPVVAYGWDAYQHDPPRPRRVAGSFREWLAMLEKGRERMAKRVRAVTRT